MPMQPGKMTPNLHFKKGFKHLQSTHEREPCVMQDQWGKAKAAKVRTYAYTHNLEMF